MKSLTYEEKITEKVEELRALLRRQQWPLAKRRLKFLLLLKSGQCPSQAVAGAHQKEVCLHHGLPLQRLPTACPELNPVERFFEELRKDMSNQVYETIEAVEEHLCQLLQPYFEDNHKIIRLTHFDYIRTG